MKIIDEPLPGVKLISFDVFKDSRGFFAERYSQRKFELLGLQYEFVQDNFSHSAAGVVRGLHYQTEPEQVKLVGCVSGKILDVVVDIRKDSPSFGKHYSVELSGDNGLMLLVPSGFAHGFAAITEADVFYKVDGFYNPKTEGGLVYNDPELGIKWPGGKAIVSDKDLKLPAFAEYKRMPVF